jgi:hypothetical protein
MEDEQRRNHKARKLTDLESEGIKAEARAQRWSGTREGATILQQLLT